MRRRGLARRGLTHVAIVVLSVGVLWIGLRSLMSLALEQARTTRRLMDREQATLLIESVERIRARRASGRSLDGFRVELAGWGAVEVRGERILATPAER